MFFNSGDKGFILS